MVTGTASLTLSSVTVTEEPSEAVVVVVVRVSYTVDVVDVLAAAES